MQFTKDTELTRYKMFTFPVVGEAALAAAGIVFPGKLPSFTTPIVATAAIHFVALFTLRIRLETMLSIVF